jgi:hypothetical protein
LTSEVLPLLLLNQIINGTVKEATFNMKIRHSASVRA